MRVSIDPGSGFCFGVDKAIQTAIAELEKGNTVYCLGELVHNQVQMDQFKAKGLKIISISDFSALRGEKVIVRAHGEPPETFQLAKDSGINVINATCPIVTRLQQRINETFLSSENTDAQIVIYGKSGHAEVVGLVGNAGNQAIIINNESELEKINFQKPVYLFSQTTMDSEGYEAIGNAIKNRMNESGNTLLTIHKSVCKQVSGRAPALRKFASDHDVIIFAGGNNSANGSWLFNICKEVNSKSYYVNDIEDIDNEWFEDCATVGVSGATSTPGWLIEKIAGLIESI